MKRTRWVVALVTWVLLAVLYCTLAGEVSTEEVVAGIAAAAAATLTSIAIRHLAGRQFRLRRIGWVRVIAVTVEDILVGTVQVATALMWRQPPSGAFVGKALPLPSEPPERAALLAVHTLSTSISPNAFVIWALPSRQQLLVHQLKGGRR